MKKFAFFLFFLCIAFVSGFLGGRFSPLFEKKGGAQEDAFFFLPSFSQTLHPIHLILIAKDEGAYLKPAIDAVNSQKYSRFTFSYIDDASEDGSYELALSLLFNRQDIRRREIPLGFLKNLEIELEKVPDETIVVLLHPRERLSHEWVLETINRYYQDPNIWVTLSAPAEPFFLERSEQKSCLTFLAHLLKGETLEEDFLQLLEEKAKGHVADLPDILTIAAKPL